MKRYPEYKDTGIEWIGTIPKHWKLNKIKYSTYVKARIGWHGLNSSDFIENGPFLVTGTDFIDGKVNWDSCYHVSEYNYIRDPYIMLKEDDLLITKDGTIGKLAIVKGLRGEATLNSGVFVTRPLKNVYLTKNMYWILKSSVFEQFIDYNKTGSTVLHLYQDMFEKFVFPVPPLHEQNVIALFLNSYNIKISELISKKRRLIELLKEQRAAMINRAVTKGLNPNAPMKDSGIEWLGKIPQHWEIKKLKFISNLISKGTTPSTLGKEIKSEGPIRFIKAENIVDNQLLKTPDFFIDNETNNILKRSQLKDKDILVVIAGATIGKVAVLDKNMLPANTNQAISFVRPNENTRTKYVWYWLQSNIIKHLTLLVTVQSAQPNLSMENLGNFFIPYPNIKEQENIGNFLTMETNRIEKSISKVKKEIELLKEYRAALISEVVTGKIDVRDSGPDKTNSR
ncbi:MAG: restriction endonuclease subunit S [Candidatus Aminicenantes bacterium]|jgi:type I restriction enzyme S subunit